MTVPQESVHNQTTTWVTFVRYSREMGRGAHAWLWESVRPDNPGAGFGGSHAGVYAVQSLLSPPARWRRLRRRPEVVCQPLNDANGGFALVVGQISVLTSEGNRRRAGLPKLMDRDSHVLSLSPPTERDGPGKCLVMHTKWVSWMRVSPLAETISSEINRWV